MNNLKKYQLEEFHKLLPNLEKILSKFEIDKNEKVFKYKKIYFIASKKNNLVSFGLASEEPIYPTLVFEYLPDGSVKLLHYRIDNNLPNKIKYLSEEVV